MATQVDVCHFFSSKFRLDFSSCILPLIFIFIFTTGGSLCWIYFFMTPWNSLESIFAIVEPEDIPPLNTIKLQLKCSNESMTFAADGLSGATCPEHFQWIHEDLRPWKSTGISRDMVEGAKSSAHFRLVIVKGQVYVEKLQNSYQTRDVFTIWGFLQLLKLYPDRVPDLELMFNCDDRPEIKKNNHQHHNATWSPVMFQYCKSGDALGVLFPDWSFWGWAEVNIKPWTSLIKRIKQGNRMKLWKDRQPYAYWRGNPYVNLIRYELMKCNVSDKHDWNARLYKQDWMKESKLGYKNSNLEDQCNHRYKIYVEGRGWSVSEKYILACDSMALFVKPEFYDFFTRSMVPMQHFWHIRPKSMCRDIKLGVEWGNNHTHKAEAIGKGGSEFIQENLKMEYVYDYMFHVLNEYAKLMKFKPTIPKGAVQIVPQTMASSQNGTWKKFMKESMVTSPLIEKLPCWMHPPCDANAFQAFFEGKDNIYRIVEMWEDEYWKTQNNTHS